MCKQNPAISLIMSLSAKAEKETELRDVSGTHHGPLRPPQINERYSRLRHSAEFQFTYQHQLKADQMRRRRESFCGRTGLQQGWKQPGVRRKEAKRHGVVPLHLPYMCSGKGDSRLVYSFFQLSRNVYGLLCMDAGSLRGLQNSFCELRASGKQPGWWPHHRAWLSPEAKIVTSWGKRDPFQHEPFCDFMIQMPGTNFEICT